MVDIPTPRLVLHQVDVEEGVRIAARTPGAGDVWAGDFPFDGDVVGVTAFLRVTAAQGDQGPFGFYRITRLADGQAVGGSGFKGLPDHGSVEIGYGLVPSARGHGFAAEAVAALLTVAAGHGVSVVRAETAVDNPASQRTLLRAGFQLFSEDGDFQRYRVGLFTAGVPCPW